MIIKKLIQGKVLTFELVAETAEEKAKLRHIHNHIDDFGKQFHQLINDF